MQEKGVALAKTAAEADKPKDMTPKDKHNIKHITQSSDESEEDSDKDNNNNRRQPNTKKRSLDESGSDSF